MSPQMLSVLIAIMVFAAVLLVVFGVSTARARASTPEMEHRLERYGHVADTTVTAHKQRPGAAMADRLDSAVKNKTFADEMQTALARADVRMTLGELLMARIGTTVVGFLVGLLLGRASLGLAIVFGIGFAAFGAMAPMMYLSRRASRRRKAFVDQLGDTIALMANSLRAGYSLLQTMELVSRESPPPMSDEFRRVVREVGLGIGPQQALNNLLRRIPSEDLDLLVSAINIQHEVGGNLGQILDVIGETIRERVRIQGEISVLTAQQKMSGYVITGLPVIMAAILFVINPEYMMGVLVWPWVCLPIGATVLLVLGFFAMRKIMAIEV